MSTKPSDLPVWAVDSVYSSGPETGEDTKIEPSTDFQEEGWKPSTYPRPEYFNWFMNLVYLWCQYLNDGDVALNDVDVAGALDVVGHFSHGNMSRVIPGSAGLFVDGGGAGVVDFPSGGLDGTIKITTGMTGSDGLTYHLRELMVGDRLKTVTFTALDSDGVTLSAITSVDVLKMNANGAAATNLGSSGAVNLTGSYQDITWAVTDTELAAGEAVIVAFAGAGTNVTILNVQYTFDRPV
jgi:hypothetical protein